VAELTTIRTTTAHMAGIRIIGSSNNEDLDLSKADKGSTVDPVMVRVANRYSASVIPASFFADISKSCHVPGVNSLIITVICSGKI
jgi:hypothetical protein